MPAFQRGPRKPAPADVAHLLGCPRLDPTWELSAVGALMKPQEREAIAHRPAEQPWDDQHAEAARRLLATAAERLDLTLNIATPGVGDYHLITDLAGTDATLGRGLALALSKRFPAHWFRLDRLLIRDGTFHKRLRNYKLELRVAHGATVPREVRAALKGLV